MLGGPNAATQRGLVFGPAGIVDSITAQLDKLITVINNVVPPPRFWLRFPLAPPEEMEDDNRVIVGGPLLDLNAIQESILDNEITPDHIWIATKKAEDDLYSLIWDEETVCEFIKILEPGDYKKSEWARSSSNSKHACDVYVVRFDHELWERDPNSLDYYFKFSVDPFGALTICVCSCHI